MAQWYRICLPMQEMQVQSLGCKDALENEMVTHSSIIAWEILWTESRAWWATVQLDMT